MTAKKRRTYVTIALRGTCSCGHMWEIVPSDIDKMDGEHTDSGTYWPGTFDVTCPGCRGVDSGSWL